MENINILNYILPLLGVILGATLQFLFSRNKDDRQLRKNLETQAYTDYLRAISSLTMAQRSNDQEKCYASLSMLIEAKSRIAIYGSKKVIECLADFERVEAKVVTPEQMSIFLKIAQAMRNSSVNMTEIILDKDLSQLLLSRDIE